MPLTINLTQLKRKKRKNGSIPIYIRITENRKSRYLSTGISVLAKFWDKKNQRVKPSHPRDDVLNFRLRKKKYKVEDKRLELEGADNLDMNALKSQVKVDNYNFLLPTAERYHESLKGTERHHEWKKFGVLINNLKKFLGSRTIDVNKVDAGFIEDFQDYLLNEVGNNPNTTRRKLTCLKGMYIRLIKAGTVKHDPFLQVDKVERNKVEKTRLTLKQIDAIKNIDLQAGGELWHTRNYFLYSFYNAGIRFGDLCCLQWGNVVDGRLKYKMMKTGGLKSIRQLEPMQQILDLYHSNNKNDTDLVFPILDRLHNNPARLRKKIGSKNVQVNERLKILAEKAGIKAHVSFHVSRHSFAHYALKKGMDLYSISKALGHADLDTTQQYLESFDEDKLDEGMDELFN